jgi:hypothetical protein
VLPVISVAAPPATDSATVSMCAQVISSLPLILDGQDLRRTTSKPASGLIQAWGDPAIVLRCGVARPKTLVPGSDEQVIGVIAGGPYFFVTSANGAQVYTTIDRAVYIEITVPAKYHSDPIVAVSKAIAKVLPAVCSTDNTIADPDKLCTRRK